MPNINDAFPSKFLKASDLGGQEPIVTIDRVDFEAVGRSREMKAVVYFANKQKGLVLNKTNATKIATVTGTSMTEEWHGHRIRLFATETEFGGDTVDCIRVKPATNSKPMPPPLPPPVTVTDIDDSEIPF